MKSAPKQSISPTYCVDFTRISHSQHAPAPSATDTEWLLTNGLGGFAMGTAASVNTRRYHSLLNVSLCPPVQRINTIANVGETILTPGGVIELDNHAFEGNDGSRVMHPQGWNYLKKFEKDLKVRWTYQLKGLRVLKELSLVWKKQAAVLRYDIEFDDSINYSSVTLQLRPYVAMRDFHQLQFEHDEFEISGEGQHVQIKRGDLPGLHMQVDQGAFIERGDWWRKFSLKQELLRQQDHLQDLFVPGVFEHTFYSKQGNQHLSFAFGTDVTSFEVDNDERAGELQKMYDAVKKQTTDTKTLFDKKTTKTKSKPKNDESTITLEQYESALKGLVVAADDFVVERTVDGKKMSTILAGYPWFADWGRDTMISLPGCLLVTGRLNEARKTLLTYAKHIRRGLVPNRFDDYGGEPHYNTVDASMWFIHAALEYLRISNDKATWDEALAKACHEIISAYRNGTDNNIHMDEDGLIVAGNQDSQLTWMDAKRDGVVFTPRYGKAVEINALWYRALQGCADVLEKDDPTAAKTYEKLARKVKRSFNKVFWNEELGYLNDCVLHEKVDHSLRPNQLLAVSLPISPLSKEKQKKVMKIIGEKLLTPRGMRTLSADDEQYHGLYIGSMFERDGAYHQGTAWGWLMGPYIEGLLRANKFNKKSRKQALSALTPLFGELSEHSLGQLHEIFDGDWPHDPKGCMAQAWSVAEVLRVSILIAIGE